MGSRKIIPNWSKTEKRLYHIICENSPEACNYSFIWLKFKTLRKKMLYKRSYDWCHIIFHQTMFFTTGNLVFRQEIDIPTSKDPVLYRAKVFLYFLESKYVQELISKALSRAHKFLGTSRLIENFCKINDDGKMVSSIQIEAIRTLYPNLGYFRTWGFQDILRPGTYFGLLEIKTFWLKRQTRKTYKFYKDFELYQLFMDQTVLIFPKMYIIDKKNWNILVWRY